MFLKLDRDNQLSVLVDDSSGSSFDKSFKSRLLMPVEYRNMGLAAISKLKKRVGLS